MFHFSSIGLFDYDRVEGMPEPLEFDTPQDWLQVMEQVVPGFASAGKLVVPSTSSRVLQDGQAAFGKGGWHCYVQFNDATDLNRFGTELMVHTMSTAFGFMRPIFCQTSGDVIGHRPWGPYDPTTFSPERLVFDGAPTLHHPDLSLAPSHQTAIEGERLDSSLLVVEEAQFETVRQRTGYRTNRQSSGLLQLTNDTDLKLDTLVTTESGDMTIQKYWMHSKKLGKLRCQAVFRPESRSQAAYLNRHRDGSPFLFDVGSQIKYVLSEHDMQDQRLKLALAYVKAESSITALARKWVDYCEFLDPVGTEQLLEAVHKKAGFNKRVLNKALAKAQQKWAEEKIHQEQKRTRAMVEAQGRRQLHWDVDESPDLVDRALAWIREDVENGHVLNYGGVAVEIVRGHPSSIRKLLAKAAKGNTYPDQELITPLTTNSAALRALKSIQFLAERRRGELAPIDCPPRVSRTLVERPQSFLPLSGLLEAPTFRPDGTPIIAPGYDKSTGFYATFSRELGRAVPDKATRDEAIASLRYIQDVFFEDFPFETDLDAAVAVAMLLTAFVGRFLSRMPGFIATAGTQQTGKSTLINATCLCAYGRPAGAAGWTDDQTEMRKVITSLLMEGQSSVCFDNLPFGARVDGDEISKLITEEVYEGRILGGNNMLRAPANLLVMITGNQLSPINDMVSRLLTIRMNAEMEDPSKRKFRRVNIEQWVEDRRAEIIGHVATIFRAWHQVGKADFSCDRRTRFSEWDELVRFPLMWLGLRDVAESFDVNRAEDPFREAWAAFFAAWHDEFGSTPVTASEIIQACNSGQDSFCAADSPADTSLAGVVYQLFEDSMPNARHLGNKLRFMCGNVIGDYKLEKIPRPDGSKKPVKWWIVDLNERQNGRGDAEPRLGASL